MSDTPSPRTLVPPARPQPFYSRSRPTAAVAGILLVVLLALVSADNWNEDRSFALFGGGLALLLGVGVVAQMRSSLRIDVNGIDIRRIGSTQRVFWRDIAGFRETEIGDAPVLLVLRHAGDPVVIGDVYRVPRNELRRTLERWHAHAQLTAEALPAPGAALPPSPVPSPRFPADGPRDG